MFMDLKTPIEIFFIISSLTLSFILMKYVVPYFNIVNSCERYFSMKIRQNIGQFKLLNLTNTNYTWDNLKMSNCTCIQDIPYSNNPDIIG